MRKINKSNEAKIKEQYEKMTSVENSYNNLMDGLQVQIQKLVNEFNAKNQSLIEGMIESHTESAEALKILSLEQAEKIDDYISDRSDKWNDSDTGYNYRTWSEMWKDLADESERNACENFDVEFFLRQFSSDAELPPFKPN